MKVKEYLEKYLENQVSKEDLAKEYCDSIDATLICINSQKFRLRFKSGETKDIYLTELDKLMNNGVTQNI